MNFRNKPCPCESGKKFKHCCWRKGNENPDYHSPIYDREYKKYIDYDKKFNGRIKNKYDQMTKSEL